MSRTSSITSRRIVAPRVSLRAFASPRALVLAGAGVLLTALYVAATVTISLPASFPGPGISLGFTQILGPDWMHVSLQYAGLVLGAFALYGVALAAVWRSRSIHPVLLFGFPVLFVLALLYMYPPTAADLFHYQADARTFWVSHANPLIVPPAAHPYAIGISWADQPSPYGPFWSLLTFPAVILAGDNYLFGLLLFKLLAGIFYLGCAWLVYRIVRRDRPGWQATAVVLLAWNPFVVLRTVGNGHNDLVMMFFVLLALERAQRRDWTTLFPALALSVLIKYITALLGPMFLLYAWCHTEGSIRERARAIAPGLALGVLVTALCYVPFWHGADTFWTVANEANGKMITSTPVLIQARLAPILGEAGATSAATTIGRVLFAVLYLPLVWQSRRDFPRLVSCSVNALFLYLLVAVAWFRPWYLLWPVTLAAVLPGTWFTPLLITITLFGSFPDLIEQYRYNWDWLNDYWRAVAAPVVEVFIPSLVIWWFGVLAFGSWHFDAPWVIRGGGTAASRPVEARTAPGGGP